MLPLGSVVELKNSTAGAKLLIIARLIVVEKNGRDGYFDYMGCPHAIGFSEQRVFYFNEEDINKVVFTGFIDNVEIEMNELNERTKKNTKTPNFKVGE